MFLPGPDHAADPLFFSVCDRKKQLHPPEAGSRQAGGGRRVWWWCVVAGWLAGMVHDGKTFGFDYYYYYYCNDYDYY